jgi:hypothetical protein
LVNKNETAANAVINFFVIYFFTSIDFYPSSALLYFYSSSSFSRPRHRSGFATLPSQKVFKNFLLFFLKSGTALLASSPDIDVSASRKGGPQQIAPEKARTTP